VSLQIQQLDVDGVVANIRRPMTRTWWSSDSDASERAVGVTAKGRCGLSCTGCDEQELLIDTR